MDQDRLRQRCYPFWVAPELLQGQVPSSSSDVYALGMLIYEMLYRREPFGGEEPEVLYACSTPLHLHAQSTHTTYDTPKLHTVLIPLILLIQSTQITCILHNPTCTMYRLHMHVPLAHHAQRTDSTCRFRLSIMHNVLTPHACSTCPACSMHSHCMHIPHEGATSAIHTSLMPHRCWVTQVWSCIVNGNGRWVLWLWHTI